MEKQRKNQSKQKDNKKKNEIFNKANKMCKRHKKVYITLLTFCKINVIKNLAIKCNNFSKNFKKYKKGINFKF